MRDISRAQEEAARCGLKLEAGATGLELTDGAMTLRLDFADELARLAPGRVHGELLVRAAKVKRRSPDSAAENNAEPAAEPCTAAEAASKDTRSASPDKAQGTGLVTSDAAKGASPIAPGTADKACASLPLCADATAGLGQDSLLLAAAGFSVVMFERNPVMAALLDDALARARQHSRLAPIVARMQLRCQDGIEGLAALPACPDVVYLDPMFPARRKSAAVKKKFQLLHRLEAPCDDADALLDAALAAQPRKVVVKRPIHGEPLGSVAPTYALSGKAIRYDVIVPAPSAR